MGAATLLLPWEEIHIDHRDQWDQERRVETLPGFPKRKLRKETPVHRAEVN